MRQSLLRVRFSFLPLLAGISWAFFAARQWAGTRGVFLGVSGVMIGVAASSALTLPFIRLVSGYRPAGSRSLTRSTYVSIAIAIAVALVLAVATFLLAPQ